MMKIRFSLTAILLAASVAGSPSNSHSQTTGPVAGRIVSLNCDARLQKNGAQTEAQLSSSRDIALGLFVGRPRPMYRRRLHGGPRLQWDEEDHGFGGLVFDSAPPAGSAISECECGDRPIAGKLRQSGRHSRKRGRLAHPLALGELRGPAGSFRHPVDAGSAENFYRGNVRVKGRHDLGTHGVDGAGRLIKIRRTFFRSGSL